METGIKGSREITVTENLLASSVGSGIVNVYATPMMIAGIEGTAAQSVQEYVGEGKTTVGTHIDMTHEAATPAGMKVRFETELTEIAAGGKMLTFKVAAYDEKGLIGQGKHTRAVVAVEKFEARAQAKLG